MPHVNNDSPECLEVHEFGVAEEHPRGGEDDQREEAVVDVAVLAEVLARVGALDLEAVVRALRVRGREGVNSSVCLRHCPLQCAVGGNPFSPEVKFYTLPAVTSNWDPHSSKVQGEHSHFASIEI